MSENSSPAQEGYGRNPEKYCEGVSSADLLKDGIYPETSNLMERMVERSNMMEALRRVVRNKGSAGVDKMTVDELEGHIREHWLSIKKALLEGRYIPQSVKRVEIPKPGGKGMCPLGIPTVQDRSYNKY